MKISGQPCPECGKLYFGLPTCSKCGWRDEAFYAWCDEQLEICRDMAWALSEFNKKGE